MIYELRIYRCVPSRMPALLSRFENKTLRIWEKHGIRQAGFWTTLIGASSLSFLVSRARVRLKNQRATAPTTWAGRKSAPRRKWCSLSASQPQVVSGLRGSVKLLAVGARR